jgi:hypothetical protein
MILASFAMFCKFVSIFCADSDVKNPFAA